MTPDFLFEGRLASPLQLGLHSLTSGRVTCQFPGVESFVPCPILLVIPENSHSINFAPNANTLN